MQADANLPKQRRPRRTQPDCNGDCRQQRGCQQYHQQRKRNVEGPLQKSARLGTVESLRIDKPLRVQGFHPDLSAELFIEIDSIVNL